MRAVAALVVAVALIGCSTEPDADEFRTWMLDQQPAVDDLAADMGRVAPLIDGGDVAGAADLSLHIGATFADMARQAPETGTEFSDVGTMMLWTCSLAYASASSAMNALDPDAIGDAATQIGACTDLMDDTTNLLRS